MRKQRWSHDENHAVWTRHSAMYIFKIKKWIRLDLFHSFADWKRETDWIDAESLRAWRYRVWHGSFQAKQHTCTVSAWLLFNAHYLLPNLMSLHKWRYNIQSYSLVNLHLRKSVDVSSLNTALTTKLSEKHHAVTNHLKQDQSQAQKIDEDKGCLPWGEGAVVSLVNVSFLSGWSEFELQTRTLY